MKTTIKQRQRARAVLRKAAARVAKPGVWTRGEFARDREGNATYPESETAVQWCATGAIYAEVAEANDAHGAVPGGVLLILDKATDDVAAQKCEQAGKGRGKDEGPTFLFNDKVAKNAKEVAAFMREVAKTIP